MVRHLCPCSENLRDLLRPFHRPLDPAADLIDHRGHRVSDRRPLFQCNNGPSRTDPVQPERFFVITLVISLFTLVQVIVFASRIPPRPLEDQWPCGKELCNFSSVAFVCVNFRSLASYWPRPCGGVFRIDVRNPRVCRRVSGGALLRACRPWLSPGRRMAPGSAWRGLSAISLVLDLGWIRLRQLHISLAIVWLNVRIP